MTHIVYNGKTLFADRKCYGASGVVLQQCKIRTVTHGEERWVWAFAGEYASCEYGDKVLMSNLDRDVIKEAKETLGLDCVNHFDGLLIIENLVTNIRKAYLVNYFGLMMALDDTTDLICVGSMAGEIQRTYKLLRTINEYTGVVIPRLCGFATDDPRIVYKSGDEVEWIIKHVTHNTAMGQDGFNIDRYNFFGGA